MKEVKKNKFSLLRPLYWASVSICTVCVIAIYLFWSAESEGMLQMKSVFSAMLYPFGGFIALVQLLAGFEPLKEQLDWGLVYPELREDTDANGRK
jgi:hypothetical protein